MSPAGLVLHYDSTLLVHRQLYEPTHEGKEVNSEHGLKVLRFLGYIALGGVFFIGGVIVWKFAHYSVHTNIAGEALAIGALALVVAYTVLGLMYCQQKLHDLRDGIVGRKFSLRRRPKAVPRGRVHPGLMTHS